MDYEKKYKEALENFKKIKNANNNNKKLVNFIECEYPELKESEDERIRKGLIKGLSAMRDIHKHQTFSDDAINIDNAIIWLEKQGEQKPAEWSEEDEKLYISALWHIKNSCGNGGKDSGEYEVYNWLKTLKDRVQPKHEWSEEDEEKLNSIIEVLGDNSLLVQWLQSIKPNHWKPSEEQMSMLLAVLNDSNNITAESVHIALKSLYQDLLKL